MNTLRACGIALAVLAAACTDTSGPAAGSGKTRILLTDDPFPYNRVAQVNIHVVRVQTAAVPDSVHATWTTVAEVDTTINILDLQAGTTWLLGQANLDATTVGAVRVVIDPSLSSVIDSAGRPVVVHWPVTTPLAINAYVQQSLTQWNAATPHDLIVDFDVGRSFEDVNHDGSLYFLPWVRAIDEASAGSLEGNVRGPVDSTGSPAPLANAAVTVLQGDPVLDNPSQWFKVATGRTDAAGHYRVAFILGGTYIVRVEPLGVPAAGCADTANIVVAAGITKALDVVLPPAPGTCAQSTGGGGGLDTNGVATDQTVAHVDIVAFPASPVVGDSVSVRANLTNAANQTLYGKATSWTVSDTTVLGITWMGGQNLLLKAKKAGSVQLTATSESVIGILTLTVQ